MTMHVVFSSPPSPKIFSTNKVQNDFIDYFCVNKKVNRVCMIRKEIDC